MSIWSRLKHLEYYVDCYYRDRIRSIENSLGGVYGNTGQKIARLERLVAKLVRPHINDTRKMTDEEAIALADKELK